jgi:hypothetical protein
MKTSASSFLLVVCVGCGVLSLGFGSCSSSSASVGEPPPLDSGVADTGAAGDSGSAADASVVFDAPFQDTSLGAPDGGSDDAGEDAGACGEPETMLGHACDQCIQTNCETPWCACASGAPDPDAGDGGSACLQYVQCVEGCVADDAGSPTTCLTMVCAPPFTAPQQQAGHALLDCLVQY